MKKILAICAIEEERVPINFPDCEVLTIVTGIGKVRSAIAVTRALIEYQPDLVISIGTVGTFDFHVGDILVCTRFIDRDYAKLQNLPGIVYKGETAVMDFIKHFKSFVNGEWVDRQDYVISTGDNFVTQGESLGADVVDMESFAVFQVCQTESIPFFGVKYVTDVIGKNSIKDWESKLADSRKALTEYFKRLDL